MNNRLIKSNDAGGGGCTNTVDLYNPFPDGGGVALYQLNGDATDVSGNYNGTATNVTYGAGQFGQAGVFNGSSSKIDLPNLGLGGSATRTISAWINVNSLSSAQTIFQYGANSNGQRFGFAIDTLGKVYVEYYNRDAVTSSAQITVGNWFHVATTYNGGAIEVPENTQIYINGLAVAMATTGVQTGLPNTANSNYGVGYDRLNTRQYFNGSIDQVRIFSRALRPYEVEALYTEEYCTPTIVPSEHFNTVTWDGEVGSGSRDFSGVGFQPDLVWVKRRSSADDHHIYDSVRGAGVTKVLSSNKTAAEPANNSALYGYVDDFTIDGFSTVSGAANNAFFNENAQSFVAWCWKAGGAAVTNTDGTITSQVSANTEAGFSVVSYTGSPSSTVGHGLGKTPDFIFVKIRTNTQGWATYHSALGSSGYLELNSTAAASTISNYWGTSGIPNDTVFGTGPSAGNGNVNGDIIAYCFAEVEGFSNFGSYVGTGASGNTVVTGFEPAFVMVKITSGVGDWWIFDNKRTTSNPRDLQLRPNSSAAESNLNGIDFLENGFNFNSALFNDSGVTFIYMAFAADPTAVEPTLENSFNTVLFTPTTSTSPLPVTGVGFQPDLVWAKYRNGVQNHYLFDSIRGGYLLRSNTTDAELTGTEYMQSFDNDGFTTVNNLFNRTETDSVVAWNWKGAEIPAINSNGSIPSVVSANPAAGFSIVSYTANGTDGASIGHGLDSAPKMIIYKGRNAAGDWIVLTTAIDGSADYLFLNTTAAKGDYPSNYIPTDNLFYSISSSSTLQFIAYCFAEVPGFSKIGSYTGTGAGVQNTINCGFAPKFVMIKRTNSTGGWRMYDNVRGLDRSIQAQSSDAEYDDTTNYLDFYANGFEFNNGVSYQSNPDINASGGTYIYMAFANQF